MAWSLAAINPLDRSDWLLENLLVFAAFGGFAYNYNYRHHSSNLRFSMASYWCFAVFLCLHLYGSHYTYAQTPVGFWLQEALGLSRNHYDRIVHFSFGVLLALPFLELLQVKARLSGRWLKLLTLSAVLSCSTFYELLEMLAAFIVSPELGTAFLGAQGDEWDAQKDTGLALVGAIVTMLIVGRSRGALEARG